MPAPTVRADYDHLTQTARDFSQESTRMRQALQQLKSQVEMLQGGDWVGTGAQAFYAEMNGLVVPALNRLVGALEAAGQTTLQIKQVMKAAEDEAARYLRGQVGAPAIASGAAAARPKSWIEEMAARARSGGGGGGLLSSIGGFFKSVGGAIKDFAIGVASEAKDMAAGIVNIFRDPIGTLKGLAYAVTHPIETAKAIAQPFIEAWESGHPFQAIGRGFFAIGSTLLGGGVAVKAVRTARGIRSAEAIADVARARVATGLADDAARAAGRGAASAQPYLMPEGFRLGQVALPNAPTRQMLGQAIEEPVRQMVGRQYGFQVPPKAASATGPDLIVPQAERARVGFDYADVKPLNEGGVRDFWNQLDNWRDYGWAGGPRGNGPGRPALRSGRAALFGYDQQGNVFLYGIYDM